jgi:formylmethanofuran dehydrogenase subunit B
VTATCLGCGLTCDDIGVTVRGNRLESLANACALGEAWFKRATQTEGHIAAPAGEIVRAAGVLRGARSPLVYLSEDLTVEAYREAIAIADVLRARLDGLTSDTAAAGILAAQTRGRAGATLGELLNRADLLIFWGVDPAERYPRFASRYAVDPRGLATPAGRKSRTLVAVDIGAARGPADADLRLQLDPAHEVAALGLFRASIQGRSVAGMPADIQAVLALQARLATAKYVALVHDAEPSNLPPSATRAEALIALAQALNGPTRAALVSLRAGGNRSGAEAVTTWQTGFPFGVDFSRGAPRYAPEPASLRLAAGWHDVVLVAGRAMSVPPSVTRTLGKTKLIAIGPDADRAGVPCEVAIVTGTAGVHEAGTAYRLDDVPLPLRPLLEAPAEARATLAAVRRRLPGGGAG